MSDLKPRITLDPPAAGDLCSDPKCGGKLVRKLKHPDNCHRKCGPELYHIVCPNCAAPKEIANE